jgi:hypothetical protein
MIRRAMLALALVASLPSCSTVPPRVGEAPARVPDADKESAYHELFDRWTRHTELYDALDTRMFVAATIQSPEFVTGRAQRMAEFQDLPAADAQALTARELAAEAGSYGFFLGVHTNDRKVNDLDRSQTIWRVALQTSAGEVTPISIERVSRPDANLRAIFLYLSDFWVGYRVRFPAALPDGRPLVAPGEAALALRLDSALGHARLEFPAYAAAVAPPVLSPAPAPVPSAKTP